MDDESRRWYHDTTQSHKADARTRQATRDADRMTEAIAEMRQALDRMSAELAKSERSRRKSDWVSLFLGIVTVVLAGATIGDIVALVVR